MRAPRLPVRAAAAAAGGSSRRPRGAGPAGRAAAWAVARPGLGARPGRAAAARRGRGRGLPSPCSFLVPRVRRRRRRRRCARDNGGPGGSGLGGAARAPRPPTHPRRRPGRGPAGWGCRRPRRAPPPPSTHPATARPDTAIGFRATFIWDDLISIFHLIASAKTLFPKKVPFPGSRDQVLDVSSWGEQFNPLQPPSSQNMSNSMNMAFTG
ncbi:uncharacterized protein [Equus przewalskii]|uniref:Uncharacterized protein n=1 Tax=Equus przewalskii TaxID=9798 RepID=A0ABM4N586_EQUPR